MGVSVGDLAYSASTGRGGLSGDVAERVVRIGAERGDSGDADHDDQGENDRVFDCRRAIFTLEEVDEFLGQRAHGISRWYQRVQFQVWIRSSGRDEAAVP